jgi:hypothetical protein
MFTKVILKIMQSEDVVVLDTIPLQKIIYLAIKNK